MSLRSLKAELDNVAEHLYDRIEETVEQHGLDPDSDDVQAVIAAVFGQDLCNYFGDWRG